MLLKQPLLVAGLLMSAASFNANASVIITSYLPVVTVTSYLPPYLPPIVTVTLDPRLPKIDTRTQYANHNLVSYTGADNVGLVYSGVSNVTWTRDANLLGSMEANPNAFGYFDRSDLINAIILSNSANSIHGLIADSANSLDNAGSGLYRLTTADFGSNGLATWFGAQAFVGFLNSIDYGGSDQWRLPTSNAKAGVNGTADNELGQLFYSELGGTGRDGIPNTSTFDNVKTYSSYWSGTEYALDHSGAWAFATFNGGQGTYSKYFQFYAWAVSPGQVAAVPSPGAVWLFGTGLVGLLGRKRRSFAG